MVKHLIMAIVDGQVKLAQYADTADGGLCGAGVRIAEFISAKSSEELQEFKNKLRGCHFISQDLLFARIEHTLGAWERVYPHLHYSAGTDILKMIDCAGIRELQDSRYIAGDSSVCKFAYVIDFDREILFIYDGRNPGPVPKGQRFAEYNKFAGIEGRGYPVFLIGKIPFKSAMVYLICPDPRKRRNEHSNRVQSGS